MSTTKVIDVTRNGVTTKIRCTEDVAKLLLSKEIGAPHSSSTPLPSSSSIPPPSSSPIPPSPRSSSIPPPRSSSIPPPPRSSSIQPPRSSSAQLPCSSTAPPPHSSPIPSPCSSSIPPPCSSSAQLPCSSSAPPLPGPSSVQDEDTDGKWDVQSIKLLKKVYHDVESQTSKPLKNKWQKVANEVNKVGYKFTAEKCRLKIKGLKSKYERHKKKNNKSGESPASDDHEDEEDFELFEKIPDVKPKAVLESGTFKKRPPVDDSSSEETEPTPVKKKLHPKRSAEILQVMLKDLVEKREEKAEQRHKEKLATANSLIEVLKDLAKHNK